jgi:hypothetical protein
MKKIIISLLAISCCITANCQKRKDIIDYFPELKNDSIIRSVLLQKQYYKIVDVGAIPDAIALIHIFDNKIENMQGEFEGYNVDDNTYTHIAYTKKAYPLYKRKCQDIYLLCYCVESVIYLVMYDQQDGKMVNSYVISDFSDDYGNIVTHSVIFSNNNIITIQIFLDPNNPTVSYILSKIDCDRHQFVEIKKIITNEANEYDDAIYNSFDILKISEKGELLESSE